MIKDSTNECGHAQDLQPLIVVVGFRKHVAISRLLGSLERAIYPIEGVDIILSLDGGYSQEVYAVCIDFSKRFKFGSVKIIARDINIGLRSHMLWCGQQSIVKGSVIVLEDDLFVDPQFYLYAQHAASFYAASNDVAGIALYSQVYNEYAGLPFKPLNNGCSGFFMQVACSWGQLWTSTQWAAFQDWYDNNSNSDLMAIDGLPVVVKNWSVSSWKKYYSAYLVDKQKTFFYPYNAYTTNCSDPGGYHIKIETNLFQSNMSYLNRKNDLFCFPPFDNDSIRYDAFMEPSSKFVFDQLKLSEDDVEIDFYGTKPMELIKNKKFVLTTRQAKKPLSAYSLSFRPFENTLLSKRENGEIRLALSTNVKFEGYNNLRPLVVYLTNFNILTKRYYLVFFCGLLKKIIEKLMIKM